MSAHLSQRWVSEALGTAALLVAIVGSGIMAQRLGNGDLLIALFINAAVTGAVLCVVIVALAPISGAHFNPLVTFQAAWHRQMPWRDVPAYLGAQLCGGIIGVGTANAMFGLPVLFASHRSRTGAGLLLGEAVATFGLLLLVNRCSKKPSQLLPVSVGAYIAAAIMFTSSTSFANPVVTIARSMSDTFAGIAVHDVVPFVIAQLGGAIAAVALTGWIAGQHP
jgi:glycerol uptake facilitator-like aquaporin